MGLKPDIDPESCEIPPASLPSTSQSNAGPSDWYADDDERLYPWTIYPPPPPPHWHWQPAQEKPQPETIENPGAPSLAGTSSSSPPDGFAFRFSDCEIPGEASVRCAFGFNDEGVYEVWYNDRLDPRPRPIARPTTTTNGHLNGSNPSTPTKSLSPNPFAAPKPPPDDRPLPPDAKGKKRLTRVPSLKEYFSDLDYLLGVCSDGPAKSFAFRRLKYLASKWSLYCLLNEYQELADMKAVPHR